MKTYSVCVPLFASTVIKVKAESKEAALEKALEKARTPSVCHQCARELEVGDVDTEALTIDCVEEL